MGAIEENICGIERKNITWRAMIKKKNDKKRERERDKSKEREREKCV